MNSSNFNKFIEDFSCINSSNANDFERILQKYPYFQAAALFLAKSNPIQSHTQGVALRSADRRVLRSWLDEEYREKLEKKKQEMIAKQAALEIEKDENKENLNIDTESINAFDKFVETETTEEQKVNSIAEENYQNTLQETSSMEVEKKVEISQNEEEIETPIFKEQADIKDTLLTPSVSKTSSQATDASFFDEIEENEKELDKKDKIEIPPTATDANFFDEIESDDEIFGDAQKDLDTYDFPDFEEKKNETKKEDKDGSFFDDI